MRSAPAAASELASVSPMSATPAGQSTTSASTDSPLGSGASPAQMESDALHTGTVVNLRDVGGHPAADGRKVRTGLVFRSGQLAAHDDPEIATLVSDGLRRVYDLRTTEELDSVPDQIPDHVTSVHLDVLADSDESIAASLGEVMSDVASVNELLASGQVQSHYEATYRNLVSMASARAAYRQLFTGLAEGDEVALFHCTAGKDRTGWAAATLLEVLGVDRAVITADYLASSKPVVAAFQPMIDAFAQAGGNPTLLTPVFEVVPAYLDAAHSEVDIVFGSFDNYLAEGLGLTADHLGALRSRLLH